MISLSGYYSSNNAAYQNIVEHLTGIASIFIFIVFLQIIFGAFVSGMDAGKIYNTWPLMGNYYFPDDNIFYNLGLAKPFL